ncbi:RNA recognition motif domain-containing protein [Ditylenchus destructor]|uniref:RNA recognition motif domain-containing protein n=1 Tax=Ditylenchus destructor TaxID=166010 RepID=A0AAD4N0T8_9BILA|nr:RNA recognition motif domain-containing protein [Ditylenchus destructor]
MEINRKKEIYSPNKTPCFIIGPLESNDVAQVRALFKNVKCSMSAIPTDAQFEKDDIIKLNYLPEQEHEICEILDSGAIIANNKEVQVRRCDPPETCTLLVEDLEDLPSRKLEQQLRDKYGKFGNIIECRIFQRQGIAEVIFSSQQELQSATEDGTDDIDQDRTLVISDLPPKFEEADLWKHFAKLGHVVDVKFENDRKTGKTLGYVIFANNDEMPKGFQTKQMISGSLVTVKNLIEDG